jgi:hypothetical protein
MQTRNTQTNTQTNKPNTHTNTQTNKPNTQSHLVQSYRLCGILSVTEPFYQLLNEPGTGKPYRMAKSIVHTSRIIWPNEFNLGKKKIDSGKNMRKKLPLGK